jgi:Icc-related predicted phosphoesterase
MKFQLLSDIHMEFLQKFYKIKPNADYLFLAGDIGKLGLSNYNYFFEYCSKNWKKVFYVLGNHEYYHNYKTIDKLNFEYKQFFSNFDNIYLLDNNGVDIEDNNQKYFIYGTTLWSNPNTTDFINDFIHIKTKNDKNWNVNISLNQFRDLHQNSMNKLIENIKNKKNIILLTHFPPLRKINKNTTSDPKYNNDDLSSYYSNHLTDDYLNKFDITESNFYKNIILWMCGHTHYSFDFTHNNTRFLSNQKGYQCENISYNEDKIYEL